MNAEHKVGEGVEVNKAEFRGGASVRCQSCDKRFRVPLELVSDMGDHLVAAAVGPCPRCGEEYAESLILPQDKAKIVCTRGMPNSALDQSRLKEWANGAGGWK